MAEAYGITGADATAYLAANPVRPEIAEAAGAHCRFAERRFFGESKPADLNCDTLRYWEYMTAENAAKDYHRIYTALYPALGDRWTSFGGSRGGEMTNLSFGLKLYDKDGMTLQEVSETELFDFVDVEVFDNFVPCSTQALEA